MKNTLFTDSKQDLARGGTEHSHQGAAATTTRARGLRARTWSGLVLCLGIAGCSSDGGPGALSGAGSGGNPAQAGGSSGTGGRAPIGGAGGASTHGGGGGGANLGGTSPAGGGGGIGTGGAGGAAGTGGAAGAGGAALAGCNNPNWKFCDDFEKYPLGTVPNGDFYPYKANGDLGENKAGASIATTTDKKVSGSQSVHFHINGQGRSFLNTDKPFPMEGNSFYGRMMIYLTDVPSGAVHWDILTAFGKGGAEGAPDYRWGGMFGHTMANYQPGDPPHNIPDSIPPSKKWICYEWKFDGPTTRLEMWMDDYEMTGESHRGFSDGWPAPMPFTTVQVGWGHYQNQLNGTDVWIDDLVIDDARIGCPPKASVPLP